MAAIASDATISEVNDEIQTLYEYFIKAGLSHKEIVDRASPLLKPIKRHELKKKFFAILKLSICCLVVSFACTSMPLSKTMNSNGRILMLKILHFWDWTSLYTNNCLLHNQFYLNEQTMVVDCQACEDIIEIDRLNGTSQDDILNLYLQRDIPVTIVDATSRWPVMEDSFTILNLTEGYLSIEEDSCMFTSNLRVPHHRKLFQKILSGESIVKWYAHWENCEKGSQRYLRKFYSRPYFMPYLVQMTESNWLFMSSGYRGEKFKSVNVLPSITVMWVAQIRGFQYVRLDPKDPCHKMCNPLEDIIEEGDIVLFNPTLWDFSYLPGEDTENLAIAAGGFMQFSFF